MTSANDLRERKKVRARLAEDKLSRLQQFFGLLPFPLPNYVHFFRGEKESLDESLRFLPSFLPEDWIRLLAGSRRTVRYGYRAAI